MLTHWFWWFLALALICLANAASLERSQKILRTHWGIRLFLWGAFALQVVFLVTLGFDWTKV